MYRLLPCANSAVPVPPVEEPYELVE